MRRLIFVRHGETKGNRERRIQGAVDSELNDMGKKQAKKVALKLKNEKIDVIYSSPLKRAHQTAVEIAKYHNKKIIVKKELIEIDCGEFESKKLGEILRDYKKRGKFFELINMFVKWIFDKDNFAFPGGENYISLTNRTMKFIKKIPGKYNTILIATHSEVIYNLARIIDMWSNWKEFYRLIDILDNCSISEFIEENGKLKIVYFDK